MATPSKKRKMNLQVNTLDNYFSRGKGKKFKSDQEKLSILESVGKVGSEESQTAKTVQKNGNEQISTSINSKEQFNSNSPVNVQSIIKSVEKVDRSEKSPTEQKNGNEQISTSINSKEQFNSNTPVNVQPIIKSVEKVDRSEKSPTEKTGQKNGNEQISASINSKEQFDINAQVNMKIKITPNYFKSLLYNIHVKEFKNYYSKLQVPHVSECCDLRLCKDFHKYFSSPECTNTYLDNQIYTLLDNPLSFWGYDIDNAINLAFEGHKYLSGDILRRLFDYIINGPSEEKMSSIALIIRTHLLYHPPCLPQLRKLYLQILHEPYDGESYFRKSELSKVGVFQYVINKLEEILTSTENQESEEVQEKVPVQKISLELLEERWNRFEPLIGPEYHEVMDKVNELESTYSTREDVLKPSELLERSIIALGLIIDILEQDFMICVEKMKRSLSSETEERVEISEPLVQHFIPSYFDRLLLAYKNTKEKPLWILLSRLLCMMVEAVHVFGNSLKTFWKYPDVNESCLDLAQKFSNIFIKSDWDSSEKFDRLQQVSVPWLRLRLGMAWANDELKLAMGNDLEDIVDIIHMHIKSQVKLEKDVKSVTTKMKTNNVSSPSFMRRARKKNAYGETLLIKLCRGQKTSLSKIEEVLSLPDIDINEGDNYGWTALHEAVNNNSAMKVKLLLTYKPLMGKGLDLTVQNLEGCTPLHEAVGNNCLEICQILLEHGGVSLLRILNSSGQTPLDLAEDNPEIKSYFLEKLRMQEKLNLNPDSELNLPDHFIRLLQLAFDAFDADNHTREVYDIIMHQLPCEELPPYNFISISQSTLVKYKKDQDQFRKLRRIIEKLAENPQNSPILIQWAEILKLH